MICLGKFRYLPLFSKMFTKPILKDYTIASLGHFFGNCCRFIAIFVLFALIVAQIAVSVHSVTHPDHIVSVAFASNRIDNNKNKHNDLPQKKDKCTICLLAQMLQNVLFQLVNVTADFDAVLTIQDNLPNAITIYQSVSFNIYAPRGPPPFLV